MSVPRVKEITIHANRNQVRAIRHGANDASELSFDATGTGFQSTNVEEALKEVKSIIHQGPNPPQTADVSDGDLWSDTATGNLWIRKSGMWEKFLGGGSDGVLDGGIF